MVCLVSKPVGIYRPRQPLESDFHRLIREHFDNFRAVYPDRYARQFGFWRPVIDKTVRQFLKCGDLHEGFARVRCPDCHHEFFIAFSCKQRCICPSCHQKRAILLGLHVAEDVCQAVPHRQFVWTIPKRLRVFFRFHRRLLHELPALAWQTVLEVYQAVLARDDLSPGGVIAIQTFGQLIHFHPHLHGLLTDGAFTRDGEFLPLPPIDREPFLRLWEHKVFQLLVDADKIQPSLVAQMRTWRHSGFNVDRGVRIEAHDRPALERLAQYMARSPFSLARVVRITASGKVLYKAERDQVQHFPTPAGRDLFGGIARNFQVFEPLDFLAELTQHIPNKGEHLIRYYGHYSNKSRGLRSKPARTDSGKAPSGGSPELRPAAGDLGDLGNPGLPGVSAAPGAGLPRAGSAQARRRWAVLIQRVYHTDPLRCPRCGGTMRIIAFLEAHQSQVIEKILRHCGLWQDPPPRAPPVPVGAPQPGEPGPGPTYEVDSEFLEHIRQEQAARPHLPWDA